MYQVFSNVVIDLFFFGLVRGAVMGIMGMDGYWTLYLGRTTLGTIVSRTSAGRHVTQARSTPSMTSPKPVGVGYVERLELGEEE